jgi:iron(III) transport system permease protein
MGEGPAGLDLMRAPAGGAGAMTERPSSRRRRQLLPASAYQTMVWVVIVVLVVGPLAPLIYTSLRSKPYYLPGSVWTLEPYRTLFADPLFWEAVKNTLIFAALTTAGSVMLGTALAVLTVRTDMPGRRWLPWLLVSPIVIPPLALVVGWMAIYGPSGYLTQVAAKVGLPVWNLSSLVGMAVLGTVVTVPVSFLICRAALHGTDPALERAGLASGASPLGVLSRVTVPLLRPAILNAAMLVFALSLEILGIPLFVGAPGRISFYSTYLYNGWINGTVPDPPFVSAGAVLLLVVVSSLLVLRNLALGSEERFVVGAAGATGNERPLELGRWRWIAASAAVGFAMLTSLVPLVGLAVMSGVTVLTTLTPPWQLGTTANWSAVVHDPILHRSVTNSLTIAALGAVLTVGLVATATIIAHRSRFTARRTIPALLMYPRAVPGIVLGIGIFWSFLMLGNAGAPLRTTIWGEMLALCIRNLTLVYVVVYPSLARMSPDLGQAAASAGATWWRTTSRITVPILRPALLVAGALMFISVLSDYDPVVFLQKPGTELMGVTMLHAWEKGLTGPVAALAVAQVGFVAAVVATTALIYRRLTRA